MPSVRPCSWWGLPSRPGHPDRWCALTAPFQPCLCRADPVIGGLFSVARSARSPPPGSRQHRALWSPDLPRPSAEANDRGHPARLTVGRDPRRVGVAGRPSGRSLLPSAPGLVKGVVTDRWGSGWPGGAWNGTGRPARWAQRIPHEHGFAEHRQRFDVDSVGLYITRNRTSEHNFRRIDIESFGVDITHVESTSNRRQRSADGHIEDSARSAPTAAGAPATRSRRRPEATSVAA